MKLKKDYLSRTLSIEQQADLLLNRFKSTYLPEHYVQASSSIYQEDTSNDRENLKRLLGEMAESRRKNELIYGLEEQQEANKQWGIGSSKIPGCYQRSLESTITGDKNGWAEFNITYDNKIYLSYPTTHISIWGTFLKAAGRLKLENGLLTIFPYSQYFEFEQDFNSLAIIFFTLQEKGFPISAENIIIVNEKGSPISRIKIGDSVKKEVDTVSFYLDETHFPSAKAIAECKNLPVESKLAALFLDVEITILNTKKYHQSLEDKISELKSRIVTFLSLLTEDILHQKQKTEESNEALDNYQQIINIIESFKTGRVELGFILNELNILAYCLYCLDLQIESESREESRTALTELESIKDSLEKFAKTPIVVQCSVAYNKKTAPFIRFYTKNPVNTCIALLRDYTKGNFLKRFFSGAWGRHHIQRVNQFLKKYAAHEFADNLSIQAIYEELFHTEDNLVNHTGKRGTLIERLLFCAKLAHEVQNEIPNDVIDIAETRNGPPIEEPVQETASTLNIALGSSQAEVLEKSENREKPMPSRKMGMAGMGVFSPSSPKSIREKSSSSDDVSSVPASIPSSLRSTP